MSRYTYSDLKSHLMALQDDLGDLYDIACHLKLSNNDAVHFPLRIQELMAQVDDLLDRAFEYEDEQ